MSETPISWRLVLFLLLAAALSGCGGSGSTDRGAGDNLPPPAALDTGMIDVAALVRAGGSAPGQREEEYRQRSARAEQVVREYRFEGPWPLEGWKAWKDYGEFQARDGILQVEATGEDVQLAVAPDFDCGRVQRILIRARVSRGSRGYLFWMTRDNPSYHGDRSIQFWLHPGDAFKTYTIEVGEHEQWDDSITGLRLDPTDKPGSVEIDSVVMMAGLNRLKADYLAVRCGLPHASLELRQDRRQVMAVSPGHPLGVDLHLPRAGEMPEPELRFAIGLSAAGADGRATVPGAPHRFLILTAAGETIFQQVLDPANQPSHGGWVESRVPLGRFTGRPLSLVFSVEPRGEVGDQDCCAVFANPRIHSGPRSRRPNLLVILVDTLRTDHLGCYGYPGQTTPHIDRLRRESVLFRHAVSSSSWTAPSVASLFTGLHPYRHGVRYVDTLELDRGFETVAERFSAAGWFTGAVSDNLLIIPENGYDQGFRTFVSKPDSVHARKAEAVTDLALSWLEHHGDRPFYLYLHYMDPHGNYQPAAPFHPGPVTSSSAAIRQFVELGKIGMVADRKKERRRFRLTPAETRRLLALYDGEIAANDFQLGRLLAWLEREGQDDNTIVVFVADHGEEFADHGKYAHATSLFDELVRVPMMVRLPGPLRQGSPGQGVDAVVRIADLGPTLLDLAAAPGFDEELDARSFRGLLDGRRPTDQQREVYLELNPYSRSPLAPGWIEATRGLRYGDLKLIYEPRTRHYRLYDLANDPGERQSLFDKGDPRSMEMAARLDRYLKEAEQAEEKNAGSLLEDRQLQQLDALGYLER